MASTAPGSGGRVLEELSTSAGYVLAQMGQVAMRRLRDAFTDHGLKPRQFQTLAVLADRGPTGQRELGELMAIDHSILVTMLNPLETDGLIERKRNCVDRRRHVVHITPAGTRRLARAADAQREAEDALFAALDEQQREQLRSLLLVLHDASSMAPDVGDVACE